MSVTAESATDAGSALDSVVDPAVDPAVDSAVASAKVAGGCAWCGRRLPTGRTGRPRRYCAQACRQRAYEQRSAVQRAGLAEDAVVLSGREFDDLTDRVYQLRCAAEDVLTAVVDGAAGPELHRLATDLMTAARALERLR